MRVLFNKGLVVTTLRGKIKILSGNGIRKDQVTATIDGHKVVGIEVPCDIRAPFKRDENIAF